MKTLRLNICFSGLVLLAACAKEPPPVSVSELLENPRLLEAKRLREEAEYLGVYDGLTPAGTGATREVAEPDASVGSDLESNREELNRRQQNPQ